MYIFNDEIIGVRALRDEPEDYALLTKWLSTPDVCEYYEGRAKPFTLEMVIDNFGRRARGEDYVNVGIIEYIGEAIGFIQYYKADPDEYDAGRLLDRSGYANPYGVDIVIGEPEFWNRGVGTKVMRGMIKYLFEKEHADLVFIDPQTRNTRAIRCYEKSGFKPLTVIPKHELCDDEYMDYQIMYIKLNNQ